jgi:hypothetical protein
MRKKLAYLSFFFVNQSVPFKNQYLYNMYCSPAIYDFCIFAYENERLWCYIPITCIYNNNITTSIGGTEFLYL